MTLTKCRACQYGDCDECAQVASGKLPPTVVVDEVEHEDCCCFHLFDGAADIASSPPSP